MTASDASSRTMSTRRATPWPPGGLRYTPAAQDALEGLALDGKTLRGSQKQGAPGAHLLSALGHRLGLTLAQHAVADKTNEIPVVMALLRQAAISRRGGQPCAIRSLA